MIVFVCQDPTAVLAALERGEEEVAILSNPTVEGIAVLTELLCPWILDHVLVGEPAIHRLAFIPMCEIDVLPSSPHSVAAALGLVEIPQNKLPGL